jgi:hypothetical protein
MVMREGIGFCLSRCSIVAWALTMGVVFHTSLRGGSYEDYESIVKLLASSWW